MNAIVEAAAQTNILLSGNEAIARGVWEAGARVATAYPGTPSTEILENLALYPDIDAQWSVNEKVSLEVAIGASMSGARAFCAMKHVGMNVASDAFMTQTLCGVGGGLVIVVCDDVGLSSSQNEQDSRYWGRFAKLPFLEPADSQEAYEMIQRAFEISEQFDVPVIVRATTRICHVKGLVRVGERNVHEPSGFVFDPAKWVMVPGNAKKRLPKLPERLKALAAFSAQTDLNRLEGDDGGPLGFVVGGPAYCHVSEAFPDSPILKLGFSHPAPLDKVRQLAGRVDKLIVVEETEPLLENEFRAAGIAVHGKDVLPSNGELTPDVLVPAIERLTGKAAGEAAKAAAAQVFPRPPTMCPACPHLGVYLSLSRLRKKVIISGDIGCYTLGAGHPWQALDTTISMGASLGVALGMDKAAAEADANKAVVAVIGDSTFLHMGMQGLLNITYNRGNVTVLLLDNRAVGMTGGQENPGTGRDIRGGAAPRVDFIKLVEALGVAQERIRQVDPYLLPVLHKTIQEEIGHDEPSVIVTNQPCVLVDYYHPQTPLRVIEEDCTGCGLCVDVGCPAIIVTRHGTETKKSGREVDLKFVRIETVACTGCNLCIETCGPKVIVPAGSP